MSIFCISNNASFDPASLENKDIFLHTKNIATLPKYLNKLNDKFLAINQRRTSVREQKKRKGAFKSHFTQEKSFQYTAAWIVKNNYSIILENFHKALLFFTSLKVHSHKVIHQKKESVANFFKFQITTIIHFVTSVIPLHKIIKKTKMSADVSLEKNRLPY